jgi:archaeosine-15-forming tRNA-guanine transglycosylase
MFDIGVSGGAMVSLYVKTLDLAVECTGVSRLTLNGSTKYLTMRVSTAKVDCSTLSTVATIVDASHSAEVRVVVSERLEATTSTGAKLLYKGTPTILRDHTVIFGGDIININ